jgi:flagellar FliJ protein
MEAPFKFGLERVRDLRVHDEDEAKEQFAASLSQRLKGEALMRAAQQQLSDARSEGIVPVNAPAPVSGLAMVSRQAWIDRLERHAVDAAARLRGLDADLQKSRQELADASRKRGVLDQLETRQREAHRRESERREGIELDEMALRIFSRRAA